MSRLSIADLQPKPKYRRPKYAGTRENGFTYVDARDEDAERARLLRKSASQLDEAQSKPALRLGRRLVNRDEPPQTPASSQFQRQFADAAADHLVRLVHKIGLPIAFGTAVPQTRPLETLDGLDAIRLKEQDRAALTRAGVNKAGGFALGALHCELRDATGPWEPPHRHYLLAGDMIEAFDKLRDQRRYKVPDEPPPLGLKKWPAPLEIKQIKPEELRYTITYLFQGWWPFRPTLLDTNGERIRADRRRLPEPRHTEFLLWLDQQRIQDLYLLLKLEVGHNGLRVRQ
jgi:hypothetical protein